MDVAAANRNSKYIVNPRNLFHEKAVSQSQSQAAAAAVVINDSNQIERPLTTNCPSRFAPSKPPSLGGLLDGKNEQVDKPLVATKQSKYNIFHYS